MKTPEEMRKAENDSIIERFKRGEGLSRISSSATWFPPRPIIKKDPKALEFVFSKNKEDDTNGIIDTNNGTRRISVVPASD